MCTNSPNVQTTIQQQDKEQAVALDRDIQVANLKLQLAQTRANAEYGASVAGQIQRQFDAIQRCAQPYANSTIVPTSYRGNIGNCVIALDLAYRMQLPPLSVMQNLYIVNGNPSWSSKFLVATINTCGRFTNLRYRKRNLGKLGKVKYNSTEWVFDNNGQKRKAIVVREYDGSEIDNWECVAYATEKATGEVLESDAVTIEMAIKEGWYTKDGSKWVTMPMLMLTYRAAAFWQRVYAPEISMGFRTTEEETDVVDVDFEDITGNAPATPAQPAQHTSRKTTSNLEAAKEQLRKKQAAQAAAPAASADKPAADQAPADKPADTKANSSDRLFDMP